MSYYFNGIILLDKSILYSPPGARVSISVDDASDLPTVADIQTDHDVTPLIGSTAQVVNDSTEYILNSQGVWIQYQPPEFSNVYTKAEIDTLLAGVASDIAAISPGFFELGTEIPDGTDLNTLETPGIYRSTSGAHTGTLINCPVASSAFRLEVKYTALTNRFIQTLQAGATAIYTRNKYNNTSWNHWFKIEGVDTGA